MNIQRLIGYLSTIEENTVEDVGTDLSVDTVIDEYASMPTVATRMFFPADQVPIVMYEHGGSPYRYGVSVDIFEIFMEKNGITDIYEGYERICKANDIAEGELALIFDSDDELKKAIHECRCCCDNKEKVKQLKNLTKTGGLLKELKDKIPIAKEPSVTEVDWKTNTNIINIDTSDNYISSFDVESFKTY